MVAGPAGFTAGAADSCSPERNCSWSSGPEGRWRVGTATQVYDRSSGGARPRADPPSFRKRGTTKTKYRAKIRWPDFKHTGAARGGPTFPGLQPPYHYTPDQWDHFVERLNFGKKLGLALLTLAEQNNGQLPESLTPAANWLATNNIPIEGDTGLCSGLVYGVLSLSTRVT